MKLRKYSGTLKRIKFPFLIRRVVGHSMVPVLPPGTKVLGWKYIMRLHVGDVVVVVHDGKEKIKRVNQIKNDQIYVLGDHSDTSTDSRHFGWLPVESVKARIIWPRT